MDIFAKLPFLNSKNDVANDDPEEVEKPWAPKHGQQKLRTLTSGQIRRAEARQLKRKTRKARRAQIRAYFAGQREAMVLRGHLQAAGIVAYADRGYEATPLQTYSSVVWLVRKFAESTDGDGRIELTGPTLRAALQSALNRWESLVGLPASKLDPAWMLPEGIMLSEESA